MFNANQDLIKPFFHDWYTRRLTTFQEVKMYQELAFPSWYFDEPTAFMKVTRYLVYNMSGHVTERNPTDLRQWHLPQRLIRELSCAVAIL